MVVLLIVVLLAFVLVRAGLCRAPLMTLLCIGLLGFTVHSGALALPAAVTTPVAHLAGDVRAWQHRQSDALSCAAAEAGALRNEDQASLERAGRLCGSPGAPSGR